MLKLIKLLIILFPSLIIIDSNNAGTSIKCYSCNDYGCGLPYTFRSHFSQIIPNCTTGCFVSLLIQKLKNYLIV